MIVTKKTKNRLRISVGLIVAFPVAILTQLTSFIIGKQRTIKYFGPWVTIFAASLQNFFPPKINKSSEFELFKSKVKDKQRIWGLLYDYTIESPDNNTVQLNIKNCPFAEALKILKISEFGYYVCQGDWKVAKNNSDKWLFERRGSIATGGKICDFTYKKIKDAGYGSTQHQYPPLLR